jgi:hypothetical protein
MSRRKRVRAVNQVCETCGVEHRTAYGFPGCAGHKRKTGAACRAQPVGGTTLCSKHGGMTPVIRKAGAARKAEAAVERTLAQVAAGHYRPDEHPFEILVELGRRLAARERALDELAGEYRAVSHEDHLQAALRLANDTSRLSAQVSKTVLDANIDERMAQISEQVSDEVVSKVLRALRGVDLLPEQTSALRRAIAEEFRGDMTPEQRERSADAFWQRQQQPYRGQALHG